MTRGNHISATESAEDVTKLLEKDVKHDFPLPVEVSAVTKLKGAMVQPCGLANHFTLTKTG